MSTPPAPLLDATERELWFAWKRAHEVLRARVADEVRATTGLSDADVAILIHTSDADGAIRQNELAARLGWDRTRLSHQLSRMESRGLISRTKIPAGVEITVSDDGLALVEVMRPVHAVAVRRHLIEPFTESQVEHLREALQRICSSAEPRE